MPYLDYLRVPNQNTAITVNVTGNLFQFEVANRETTLVGRVNQDSQYQPRFAANLCSELSTEGSNGFIWHPIRHVERYIATATKMRVIAFIIRGYASYNLLGFRSFVKVFAPSIDLAIPPYFTNCSYSADSVSSFGPSDSTMGASIDHCIAEATIKLIGCFRSLYKIMINSI